MKKTTIATVLMLVFVVTSYAQDFTNGMKKLVFDTNVTDDDKAINKFLSTNKLSKENTFRLIRTTKDRTGTTHSRYQQYYKGIKVEFGILITHKKEGVVNSINGEIYDASKVNLTPSLSKESSLNKAIEHLKITKASWYDVSAKRVAKDEINSELVIVPDYNTGLKTVVLAYKFEVFASEPNIKGDSYIDAQDGRSVLFNAKLKHFHRSFDNAKVTTPKNVNKARNNRMVTGTADTRYLGQQSIETRQETDGTFTLNDDAEKIFTKDALNGDPSDRPLPYYTTFGEFSDNDNNWTAAEHNNVDLDNAALDAHYTASKVKEYWATVHNRDSYDDNGAQLVSFIHVGTNYNNAFWDGNAMSYGDGNSSPLTSFDIGAHEIGHAVTDFTANLVYANQSGGLNEGYSDIWGAAIQHYAYGTGTDTTPDASVWDIGEDIGSIRSMSDPNSFSDPDTYLGNFWIQTADEGTCRPVDANDDCGVHTNSGVLNHWFHILVAGKTGTNDMGNSYNVTGIGMNKAEEIAYLMLRDYLTPNATYLEARNAALDVALNLYSCNSTELIAIQNAWYAVNVGEEYIAADDDVSLLKFADQSVNIGCGGFAPTITLLNGGVNMISSVNVSYTIDGGAETQETASVSIASCETANFTISSIGSLSKGSHTITVTTTVDNDGRAGNNTKSLTFVINDSGTENTLNSFESEGDALLTYNEGDVEQSQWSRGVATGALLSDNTNNVYGTNLTGFYSNLTKAYLVSQCYDLSAMTDPTLKFDMAFDLEGNWDIMYMEYSLDSGENWSVLGTANDPNWYNSDRTNASSGSANDCQNCPGAQWTGNGEDIGQGGTTNATMKEYSYSLSAFDSNSGTPATNIVFRFTFHSDTSVVEEGAIVDNFVIEGQSLSIKENVFDQFSYYPNPSNGSLKVAFTPKGFDKNIVINVYDLSGRNVYTKSFKPSTNFTADLNLESLNTGMYVMDIQQGDNNQYAKIIMN